MDIISLLPVPSNVVWCTLSFLLFSQQSQGHFFQIRSFSLFQLRITEKVCICIDKIVCGGFLFFTFLLTQLQLKKPFDEVGHLTTIS